jgi:hypothetical protein
VLGLVIYQARAPQSKWKSYHDLAIKLEQGLPDINLIVESNDTKYAAVNVLWDDVQQIIKSGTARLRARDHIPRQSILRSRAQYIIGH